MPEDFIASTQYGDLKGTAQMDGFDGPPLHELARRTDMPAGYLPVGLSFYGLTVKNGEMSFSVVAVRGEEAGNTIDAVQEYARQNNRLTVYRFSGTIPLAELPGLFKRLSIKVIHKALAGVEVEVGDDPDDE